MKRVNYILTLMKGRSFEYLKNLKKKNISPSWFLEEMFPRCAKEKQGDERGEREKKRKRQKEELI